MKRTRRNTNNPNYDDQRTLLAIEAFSSEGFLAVNKTLIQAFGLNHAVFISYLIEKFRFHMEKGSLCTDGSFYSTIDKTSEKTGMSPHQIRKCKKELVQENIISTIMKDAPPKEYYKINMDELIEKSVSRINVRKIQGLMFEKFEDYPSNNKENKNKEKNIKKNKPSSSFLGLFPKEWIKDKTFQEIIEQYEQHRKEINKKLTKTAQTRLANKLKTHPKETVISSLQLSIENGWTGVFPESQSNNRNNPNKKGSPALNPEDDPACFEFYNNYNPNL